MTRTRSVGERSAAGLEVQRDLGERRVRHGRDDAGRAHALAVCVDGAAGGLERRGAGHAAAPVDAEPLRVVGTGGQRGVLCRVPRRCQRHRRAAVERQA